MCVFKLNEDHFLDRQFYQQACFVKLLTHLIQLHDIRLLGDGITIYQSLMKQTEFVCIVEPNNKNYYQCSYN